MRNLLVVVALLLITGLVSAAPFPFPGKPGTYGGSTPAYETSITAKQEAQGTSVSVGYPSGSEEGDWIVIVVGIDGNNQNPTVADDQASSKTWTRTKYLSGLGKTCGFFERRIGGGEETISGLTITASHGNDDSLIHVIRISGATTAVTTADSNATSAVMDFGSVTTTQTNSVVVAAGCVDGSRSWSSMGTGYTEVQDGVSNTVVTAMIGYIQLTSSGVETPGDATISASADWFSVTGGYE